MFDSAGKPVIDPAPADPAFQSLASGGYWQVAGPGGTAQSPSLWDQSLPDRPAKTDGWSIATAAGPFDKQPTPLSRRAQPDMRPLHAILRVGASDEEIPYSLPEFEKPSALSLRHLLLVVSTMADAPVHTRRRSS